MATDPLLCEEWFGKHDETIYLAKNPNTPKTKTRPEWLLQEPTGADLHHFFLQSATACLLILRRVCGVGSIGSVEIPGEAGTEVRSIIFPSRPAAL